MQVTKTLYVTNRAAWRSWLKEHHATEPEIWLVYYRKETGKPRIVYNDAVEEALCFGWIDSNVKRLDGERYAQRFSPRKSKGAYSPANQERLRKLIEQGKVIPPVLASIQEQGALASTFEIPEDILHAIRLDPEAWKNFQTFPDPYVRIRIGFIEGARNRPAEFRKRLNYFIKMSAKNKRFGFGGIEVHYSDSSPGPSRKRPRASP